MNGDGRRRSVEQEQSEGALRDLFAHAAPREQPPAAVAEEIRRAVYAEWDAVTGRRVWLRRGGAVAAAAAVIAAAVLLTFGREPTIPGPAVARVERVLGTVAFKGDGRDGPLRVGDELAAGATLATGSGQLALRLTSGGSLRLAPQSRVTLTAANAAKLDAGALYFDSEHAPARGQPFAVETPQGVLRDVGTQFVARVDTVGLELGVRDGRVALTRGTSTTAAAAGERLTVGRGSDVRRDALPAFGSDWAWTERLAPPFDIDGRPLIQVLEWIAAQTGRTLAFADPALERLARETVLSGSIDLEPMQKLAAVLATTGDLDYAIEGARLLILEK